MNDTTPDIVLTRTLRDNLYTIGTLEVPSTGLKLHAMERPWKDNQRWVSCIPTGDYTIKARKHGGMFQRYQRRYDHEFIPEIHNVQGRDDILIHVGNWVEDCVGCVLVGTGKTSDAEGNLMLTHSTKAYKELYKALFTLMDCNMRSPECIATMRIMDKDYG